ncbi:MAG: GerMN domain-containing protein [Armatimonadetes bacterium]|nr:GerMN domain-containing protein [Armatimonadota bacterium]
MSNRKSSSSLVVAVLMIGVLGLVGWAAYVKFAPVNEPPAPEPVNQGNPPPVEEPLGVKLFMPTYENGTLGFDTTEGTVPAGADPCVYAVNHYLRSLDAVPEGAAAVSCEIEDGVATLDFNDEFRQTYGTEDEMILYNGILTVMGQFDEVASVRFLAAGEPIDTLGNLDLTGSHPVVR